MYNPAIGRFLQTDPIGYADGINWYTYCANNPIMLIDPSGELPEWAWRVLASGPSIPQGMVDFVSGMGDNLSFGATKMIRKVGNFNDEVNTDAEWYAAGEWSGTALSTAIGVSGGLKAAGSKAAGKQFSHYIPDRTLKKTGSNFIRNTFGRSRLNGNFVPKNFHALADPKAYQFMSKTWKSANPIMNPAMRQIHRIPNVYKGAAAGFLYGIGSMEMNDFIDSHVPDNILGFGEGRK
jgi:uncharacterized protein RhaS with RHS repeats